MKSAHIVLMMVLISIVCISGGSLANVPKEQMAVHSQRGCQGYANGASIAYSLQIQDKSEDVIRAKLHELYDFDSGECDMVINTAKLVRREKGPMSVDGVRQFVYQHCVGVVGQP